MRGAQGINKVHLNRDGEDFIVLVESGDTLSKWKNDSSVPLAQVVDGFKVFTTHSQGPQGIMDSASKASLDSAFGTHNEDEVIKTILMEGQLQKTTAQERGGSTNDSIGSMANHR